MKKYMLIGLIWVFMAGCGNDQVPQVQVQVPHQVGGFVLGDDVSNYQEQLQMGTDLPIRHMESIHEVEIKKNALFKSGLISYGKCAEPGKIIRIKLKYADSSREFYDALLERFKERFGEPHEWRGDSFQVVIAWKWSFKDKDNNRISLILQHNVEDIEQKMGNSIKMTMTSQVEKEKHCYEAKQPPKDLKKRLPSPVIKDREALDWDMLIPK